MWKHSCCWGDPGQSSTKPALTNKEKKNLLENSASFFISLNGKQKVNYVITNCKAVKAVTEAKRKENSVKAVRMCENYVTFQALEKCIGQRAGQLAPEILSLCPVKLHLQDKVRSWEMESKARDQNHWLCPAGNASSPLSDMAKLSGEKTSNTFFKLNTFFPCFLPCIQSSLHFWST